MTVIISILNALGRIPPKLEKEILAGVDDGIAAMQAHVHVADLGINIVLNDCVHEDTGVGGVAHGSEGCTIYIDPYNPQLSKNTCQDVAAIVVHEVHHILRLREFEIKSWRDWCAGSVIVLEGLATQTEYFLGYGVPKNVDGAGIMDVMPMLKRIKPDAAKCDADYWWIYDLNELPSNIYKAIYPMGYYLVGAYLEKVNQNPIEALTTPWELIWEEGAAELGL